MDIGWWGAQLASFVMANGEPDTLARRTELDNLKYSLTSHEIRYLRNMLNEITFKTDPCLRFPHEILIIIASHLDLDDIMRLPLVSGKWQERFSSPDFYAEIMGKHFPLLWDEFTAEAGPVDPTFTKELKVTYSRRFKLAANDRMSRLHGQYHSMSAYYYNFEKDQFTEKQYNNGRVAFQPLENELLVKSLRTEWSDTFRTSNRRTIRRWLLSDEYIIGMTKGPEFLIAWPLSGSEEPGAYFRVQITSSISHISARGNQVGILADNGQVFIWSIGGIVRDLTEETKHTQQLPDFDWQKSWTIFHPNSPNHFFIITEAWSNSPFMNPAHPLRLQFRTQLVVKEIINETFSSSYQVYLFADTPHPLRIPDVITLRPTLSGSTICVTEVGLQTTMGSEVDGNRQLHCQHPWTLKDLKQDQVEHLVLVNFDIYTKTFAFQSHHLPFAAMNQDVNLPGHRVGSRQALIWREQALLPVYEIACSLGSMQLGVAETFVMAFNDCQKVTRRANVSSLEKQTKLIQRPNDNRNIAEPKIPWYLKQVDKHELLAPVNRDFYQDGIEYYWIGGSHFASEAERPFAPEAIIFDPCHMMRGDDEFVVLFGDDCGMMVWCFNKNVTLPKSWSTTDPSVP